MDRTRPNDSTREAESSEARARHDADRMPTEEEAALAEEGAADVGEGEMDTVGENYEEMARRGANHPGEGRIE